MSTISIKEVIQKTMEESGFNDEKLILFRLKKITNFDTEEIL